MIMRSVYMFIFHENQTHFHMKGTRFETEPQGSSEMASDYLDFSGNTCPRNDCTLRDVARIRNVQNCIMLT